MCCLDAAGVRGGASGAAAIRQRRATGAGEYARDLISREVSERLLATVQLPLSPLDESGHFAACHRPPGRRMQMIYENARRTDIDLRSICARGVPAGTDL